MKKERILYFDFIKLIATICVFTCHFTRSLELHGIGFDYKVLPDTVFSIYLGNFGVTLFFIVSGAALMYVYDKKLEVKTYVKKRLIGIYPLYWLTYAIAFLITFWNYGIDWSIPLGRMIYSILGCDGNMLWFDPNFYMVGEWFLSVIILLYLVFPILRKGVQKYPSITLFATAALLILLSVFWDSKLPLDCFFLARMFEFTFGMYFVKVIKKPDAFLAAIGAVVLAVIVIFENELSFLNTTIRTAIVGIAMFCVLAWLLQGIKGELPQKISAFVNKYMYGFFLAHHFVEKEVLRQFTGRYMTTIDIWLAYGICLAASVLATLLLSKLNQKIMGRISRIRAAVG